jgi:tetratricopeptide (TPR) repeat protein
LVRLHLGDNEGYRKACAVIVERFGKTTGGATPNLGAWSYILAPKALNDYAALVSWAEKQAGAQPQDFAHLSTLGAALYRAGRFDDALKRLQEANASYKPADEQRTAIAYVWCFLVMAHHRLGHAAEARQWLNKAVTQIDGRLAGSLPHGGDGKTSAGSAASIPWNRRLTLGLLRREAEVLLNGKKSEH